ncbi:hypothetical protein [Pendulispora rubella]|uniref:hypothetical protein n=1 Tax=Pendulispora rubella TaxID=2741070 RepID=UPI0038B30925
MAAVHHGGLVVEPNRQVGQSTHAFNVAAVHHGGLVDGDPARRGRDRGHPSTWPPFITADRSPVSICSMETGSPFNVAAVHHGGSVEEVRCSRPFNVAAVHHGGLARARVPPSC